MSFPVVMQHGMCCTGDVWHNFRRYFEARGARVATPTLSPELRVRRKVPRELGRVSLSDYVDQLCDEVARLEAQTGETPALIGHSMGGLLAQLVAEKNVVRAAVFISPTPPVGARSVADRLVWGSIRAFGAVGLTPSIIRPGPRVTGRVVFNVTEPEVARTAHANMVAESGRAFRDFATASIDESKIRIPVLTVAATRDALIPAAATRRTAQKYAAIGGELLEYSKHGHWLYDEPGWEEPAGDIFEWLQARLAGSDQPASLAS